MARVEFPIIGSRQVDRAWAVNKQRSVNFYVEAEGDGAAAVMTMKPTSGTILLGTQGNGPARSDYVEFAGNCYVVSGGQLVKITTAWVMSSVGNLNTNVGNVSMIAGRTYLMLVDGGDGYTWNGTTFAVISDVDFPASPSYCGYLDGFFMVNDANSDEWQISASEDPTAWDGLDFSSADAHPDNITAIIASYRDIYMIGPKTSQVFFNSNNADFPFDIYSNGVLEWGIAAPFSLARIGGVLFLLGQGKDTSLSVLMVNGFQAQKISDPDLAYTISRFSTVADAKGFAYTQADQTFYELTFPTEEVTFAYHVEQDMWHERTSYGLDRHRLQGYGYFNGRHLVGDFANGNTYYLDAETYTDNGDPILRKRIATMLQRENRQFEVNEFEIEFKRGVGISGTAQGSDPEVMLRYSPDGGNTWSSELRQKLGKIGEYTRRAIWTQLGTMDQFTPEISMSDPVETIIIRASMEVEVLDA